MDELCWAEVNRLRARVAELEATANCGEGHDPTRICCAHAADVKRLRARVADLEGIEQRALGVIDDGDPDETPIARYILGREQ